MKDIALAMKLDNVFFLLSGYALDPEVAVVQSPSGTMMEAMLAVEQGKPVCVTTYTKLREAVESIRKTLEAVNPHVWVISEDD